MERLAETVYPAEWPGFPNEIEEHERFKEFVLPVDALAVNEALKNEEATAFEQADRSPIYDYEVEIQRPITPPKSKPEKLGLRERAKRIMSQAAEAVRETSASAIATTQATIEGTRGRRGKIAGSVAGAVVLAGAVYLEYKGLGSSTAVKEVGQAHHNASETLSHNHEHVRHLAKVALHKGENPWTVTVDQLHAHGVVHPSKARIAADDARLMKLNHLTPLKALKLHVGHTLNLLKKW